MSFSLDVFKAELEEFCFWDPTAEQDINGTCSPLYTSSAEIQREVRSLGERLVTRVSPAVGTEVNKLFQTFIRKIPPFSFSELDGTQPTVEQFRQINFGIFRASTDAFLVCTQPVTLEMQDHATYVFEANRPLLKAFVIGNIRNLKCVQNAARIVQSELGAIASGLSVGEGGLISPEGIVQIFQLAHDLSLIRLFDTSPNVQSTIGAIQQKAAELRAWLQTPEGKSIKELNGFGKNLLSIPLETVNLSALRSLNLGSNSIRVIPDSIGRLQALTYLGLHENEIYDLPETLGNLIQLTELDVCGNNLVHLPSSLTELQNLVKLDASRNDLRDFDIAILDLPRLKSVCLSGNDCLPTLLLPRELAHQIRQRGTSVDVDYTQ